MGDSCCSSKEKESGSCCESDVEASGSNVALKILKSRYPTQPILDKIGSNPKICFINFYEGDFNLNLGLPFVSATLKKAGYPVKILEYDKDSAKDFDVSEFNIVGFSLRIEKCLAFYLQKIEEIKTTTDKLVLVGGPIVYSSPEKVLLETKADYICSGEGERLIVEFMDAIKNKDYEKLHSIAGLGYRQDDKIVINQPGPIVDPNELPPPDFESFDMEKYLSYYVDKNYGDRVINIYSSRGCPFSCKFCYHTFGKTWRGQSPQKMVEDLKYLKDKFNIKTVLFHDEVFVHKRERILEFCELMKPLGIKWFCQTRANNITEEILLKMKESGCIELKMGLESGSERMLKLMNKGQTVDIMWRAVESHQKLGMPVKAGFMIGMPGERLEDVKDTLKFMRRIYKACPGSDLRTYFYTPRPMTPWYDDAIKNGMKDFNLRELSDVNKAVSLFNGGFFNTSEMTTKQIETILIRSRIMCLYYSTFRKKGGLKKLGKMMGNYLGNFNSFKNLLSKAYDQIVLSSEGLFKDVSQENPESNQGA